MSSLLYIDSCYLDFLIISCLTKVGVDRPKRRKIIKIVSGEEEKLFWIIIIYIIIIIIIIIINIMKEANHAGRYISNIILTLHRLVQGRIRTLRQHNLARQKSPILTAQTTRPLQKNWFRGELWCASIWHGLRIRLHDTLWCGCDTAAYDHSDAEEIGKT